MNEKMMVHAVRDI